jgi:cytochrome c553
MRASKAWVRWTSIALGSIIGLAIGCLFALQLVSGFKENRDYPISASALALDATPDLARGAHLVTVGCTGCHGGDLAGTMRFDNFPMGRLWSANLTSGTGGIGKTFSDADYVRALRYGVGPDAHTIRLMPTRSFSHFSDADLASIVAFLRTIPPVDRERPSTRLGPVARILTVLTPFPLFSAEQVEANPDRTQPPATDTLGYGTYLAHIGGCIECHGEHLTGDYGPNITPGSQVGQWKEEQFMSALRTGKRPDGTLIAETMPWKDFALFTDGELDAVWHYTRSVPAVAPPRKR